MSKIKSTIKTFSCALSNDTKGRCNVPRYLYHVTSKANYEKMLQDGFIKKSHDFAQDTNLNGVFMFDLKNFTKRWCNMGFYIGENTQENIFSLAKALFMKTSSKTSDIVALRIPTRSLSLGKLKCRVQGVNLTLSHANNGDSALRQKHYTRKKQPIEYIFEDNIPLNCVEKVGEADSGVILEDLLKENVSGVSLYEKINPKELLAKLFKGQPEEKCIEISKNSTIEFKSL